MIGMRVLVTGASGYIGRAVVQQLLGAGHEPIGLVHRTALDMDTVLCRRGDIVDARSVHDAVAGVDAIVHLAAMTGVLNAFGQPVRYYQVNTGGTLNLLEAAMERATVPVRFVFASTSAVYGAPAGQPIDEGVAPDPRSPYAASKLAAEQAVGWQAATGALGAVALRLGNVAGAVGGHGDSVETRIITRACAVAAARIPGLEVFGDGGAVRDFVHVSDVARAFVLALDVCEPGQHRTVNIGGTAASVADIIAMVREVTGREVPVTYRPARVGEVRELRVDTTRARELLGWRLRHSTLRQLVSDQWRAERRAAVTVPPTDQPIHRAAR